MIKSNRNRGHRGEQTEWSDQKKQRERKGNFMKQRPLQE